MSMDKLAKELKAQMTASDDRKPKPYDTQAEVLRVEDGTAWVHIPGGVQETPVRLTMNAKKGDMVNVHVANGTAWITGNGTNPPTDDTTANAAKSIAIIADDKSEEALAEASRAKDAADRAEAEAGRAKTAADNAVYQAGIAKDAADDAEESAISANKSANAALTQLGVVEDVVGTLDWISKHATYKPTTDTEVVGGKLYFVKSGNTYTPVSNPSGNPSEAGYYEIDDIDEAVTNYVSSHLSLNDDGLWVVNDDDSYKILLASDGMKVYDAEGKLVSTFGESITFSGDISQYIGNDNAYIIFNPTNGGSITIGGSNINLGSDKTLTEVLSELNGTLIYDHTYEYVKDANNKPIRADFTAFLYRGGVDVKTEYEASSFTWYLKKEEKGTGEVTETLIGTGYTCSVNLSDCGYGAEVIGKFTLADNANALSTDRDNLTDTNNSNLSVRATGDSVRVRDLSASTTIFPTDKVMIVGAEDEHLVTMQTLQDYLNVNLNKQILFNTTAAWDAQVQLQSQANTLYIYTDRQIDSQGNRIAGIKVGDGNAYLIDMPFTDSAIMEHISDNIRHISAEERAFWNNKVSCYLADGDRVIFTTA